MARQGVVHTIDQLVPPEEVAGVCQLKRLQTLVGVPQIRSARLETRELENLQRRLLESLAAPAPDQPAVLNPPFVAAAPSTVKQLR